MDELAKLIEDFRVKAEFHLKEYEILHSKLHFEFFNLYNGLMQLAMHLQKEHERLHIW